MYESMMKDNYILFSYFVSAFVVIYCNKRKVKNMIETEVVELRCYDVSQFINEMACFGWSLVSTESINQAYRAPGYSVTFQRDTSMKFYKELDLLYREYSYKRIWISEGREDGHLSSLASEILVSNRIGFAYLVVFGISIILFFIGLVLAITGRSALLIVSLCLLGLSIVLFLIRRNKTKKLEERETTEMQEDFESHINDVSKIVEKAKELRDKAGTESFPENNISN